MDPYQTPGAFSWCELITPDPEAARDFYKSLFGWSVDTMPMPQGPYHVLKVGDTSVGGIMKTPAEAGAMPPAWGCYVTVENVEQTLKTCLELGGKSIVPPMDVPGVGRMAVIQDPQGALLNVITYAAPAAS